ncbi:MAG TPA: cytochrome P450 [Pirellulaceae bacterium]|nr:cytochrome P450 [Pirellulaceae bacterium]
MPHELPPGPGSPAWWQLVRYSLWPLGFLERGRRRFGETFTTRMAGYGKIVILSNPEAVKGVFRGDPRVLHSGEGNEFLSTSVGKHSVLVLDDEPHERQRRVLLPPLKGERMRAFFAAIQEATLETIGSWKVGNRVKLEEPMRRITARVILQAVLGWPVDERLKEMEAKVHHLLSYTRSRWSLILMKLFSPQRFKPSQKVPFYRALSQLDAGVYAAMFRARQEPAGSRPECVLTDLLSATHADGTPLADEEIRDAVVTLLFAGHETTSVALAWAFAEIVPHENVVGEIQHELHRVCGEALPTAEQMPQLEYLDAAIREVLRLRTVLPFVVRKTKAPFVAGGREYPEGVLLAPCSHLVHQRPDLFPDPGKFRPERFLERKFTPYEWFPFGGGNRVCLGMAFALYEMKVVLATVLATCRLSRPRPEGRYVRRGLTLAPSDGAWVVREK